MTDPAPTPPNAAPAKQTRREAVAALQRTLENADPGALAALRRFKPGSRPPAAFYRVAVPAIEEQLPEGGKLRDIFEDRWAVIAAAMARGIDFLAPVPLGEALANAGVAEMRVVRLLEATDAQLADLVPMLVHQLVQKGQSFNPKDLADLVLSSNDNRDPRRRIAQSFYRPERPEGA